MTTALPPCLMLIDDWRPLYRAAILETNKRILPQRVSEAEAAVIMRRREIFYGNGTLEEKEALEDALYALHAFTTAWQVFEARQVASSTSKRKSDRVLSAYKKSA